jgi:hypothetical protein
MPFKDLLGVAKQKGYLRADYQPKQTSGHVMIYSAGKVSAN